MNNLYSLPKKIGRLTGRRRVEYGSYDESQRREVLDLVKSIPKGSNAVFTEEGETMGGGTNWYKRYTLSFYRVTIKQRKSMLSEEKRERRKEWEKGNHQSDGAPITAGDPMLGIRRELTHLC